MRRRRGRYPGAPEPPFTPGYAMVGVVDQTGPPTSPDAQISSPAPGQVVAALPVYGGYSQYPCLPVNEWVPAPAGLDPAEAVCLVLSCVAAHQVLQRVARVARGQRILVPGAAGGVGTAVLELGHPAGLVMYGTASKPKHRLVTRLGATPIEDQSEDFVARVAALTGGAGADAAFDPMGAAHLRQSARAVRPGGTVVGYGFYATATRGRSVVLDVLSQYLWLRLGSLPPQRKHTAFYDIRSQKAKHPDWFRQDLRALLDLLAEGELHPVIAARLPLDEVVRAHELVEHAKGEGAVVLLPNP
jgi:NADPH:quinone reductase-like Zn-dependent oxidoreductase